MNEKPMKLEFVVFKISQENAVFLWRIFVWFLQNLGFDVTGDVSPYENSDLPPQAEEELQNVHKYWKRAKLRDVTHVLENLLKEEQEQEEGFPE